MQPRSPKLTKRKLPLSVSQTDLSISDLAAEFVRLAQHQQSSHAALRAAQEDLSTAVQRWNLAKSDTAQKYAALRKAEAAAKALFEEHAEGCKTVKPTSSQAPQILKDSISQLYRYFAGDPEASQKRAVIRTLLDRVERIDHTLLPQV
jgi:hypothetical protein